MKQIEAQKKRKLLRILMMPARLLRRVQDFYVRSVTDLSRTTTSGRVPVLRRSFSDVSLGYANREGDDYRELVRAASVRSLGRRNEPERQIQESRGLRKSGSVALRRIDEDKSLELGYNEDCIIKKEVDSLYPRSRSSASAFCDRTFLV